MEEVGKDREREREKKVWEKREERAIFPSQTLEREMEKIMKIFGPKIN
jgi:hypothetical protein